MNEYWTRTDIEPPENITLLLLLTFIDVRKIGYEVIYTGFYKKDHGFFVNSILTDKSCKYFDEETCMIWDEHNELFLDLGSDSIKIEGYRVMS